MDLQQRQGRRCLSKDLEDCVCFFMLLDEMPILKIEKKISLIIEDATSLRLYQLVRQVLHLLKNYVFFFCLYLLFVWSEEEVGGM